MQIANYSRRFCLIIIVIEKFVEKFDSEIHFIERYFNYNTRGLVGAVIMKWFQFHLSITMHDQYRSEREWLHSPLRFFPGKPLPLVHWQ